ncbi:MAG: pseudouridine synthase [Pseudomonadota bacterium]
MTERRKTAQGLTAKHKQSRKRRNAGRDKIIESGEGERIAKYLARCGVASRRACEDLIAKGQVFVNGERLITPAVRVTGREDIRVGKKRIAPPEATRLWRYHKPAGLITTNKDPGGRRTIFDELPRSLPRLVTVGRLDLNTEGLLLLTNNGELARALELPGNGFERSYRARAHGKIDGERLQQLESGITVDGETFGSIKVEVEREMGSNSWLLVSLREGKKREVRRALEAVGLQVNRLIRIRYGSFELGDLTPGRVKEVPNRILREELKSVYPAIEKEPAPRSPFEGNKKSR